MFRRRNRTPEELLPEALEERIDDAGTGYDFQLGYHITIRVLAVQDDCSYCHDYWGLSISYRSGACCECSGKVTV
jgi:hypothetical protein